MNKKDKTKALKEAFKQAQEIIDYYKGKTFEELEEIDTSELTCLGSFFNWLPQSGYDYNENQTAEEVANLCEQADHRKARKEHFYRVSFFNDLDVCKASFKVCQRGKVDKIKILAEIMETYPQYIDLIKGLKPVIRAIRKADF